MVQYNSVLHSWVTPSELYHFGIRGMKWGVRRYQNSDGSLTNAGKSRYSVSVSDVRKTKGLIDNSAKTAKASSELLGKQTSWTSRKRMDLSGKTDKELRDAINRELLERQYNQVFNTPTMSVGRSRVRDIMDSAAAGLTLTSTALGVGLAVKELMK